MSRSQHLKQRCSFLLTKPFFVLLALFFLTAYLPGQEEVRKNDWSLSGQTGYLLQTGGTNGAFLESIDGSEGYAFDLVLEARRTPGFSLLMTQSLRFADEGNNGIGGSSYFLPIRAQLTHYELLFGLQGNLRIGSGDLSLNASVGPGVYWYRRQLPNGMLSTMDAFSEQAIIERYRGVLHLGGRVGLKYTYWFSPDFGLAAGGNLILTGIAQLGGTERVGDQGLLILRERSRRREIAREFTIPESAEIPDRLTALPDFTPALNFFLGFTFNL
jgi:hypothetical protein